MWRMMTTIMSAVLLVATLAAAVIGPTSSVGAAEPNMSPPPAANYDTLGNCRALREDYPTALATGRTHILVVDRTDPITANQLTILEDALRRIEGRLNLGDTLFVHQITDNYVRHRQALMAECVPGCEERSVLEVLYKRRCDEARNARLKASVVDLMWQTVGTIVANTGTLPFTQIIGTLNALAIDYSDRPNKTFYLYSDLVEYRPDANRTRPVVTFFRMTEEARTKYQASEADRIPNLSGSTVYVFGFGARQSGLAAGDEEYPALRAFWEWWFRQAGASVDLRTPADAF